MRVVVVGAGFAGLAAAHALVLAGAEVVVLEARDRVGGRVWSVPFGGTVVERGAEFILPDHESVRATAARLGLRLREKGMTYGDREPRGGWPVSRPELLAAYAALRAARDAGRLEGSVVEALATLPMPLGAREAIRARIEVSTAYPADDQDAAVLAESGTSAGDYPTHTVEGGNQAIAHELAARVGDAIRLNAPVERIGWWRHGVRVAAGELELDANAAVVTVPAAVMDGIAFDPPLPGEKARALAAVRYGQAAKVFLPLARGVPPSATLDVPGRFWTYTQLDEAGAPIPVAGAFAGSPAALERLALAEGPSRWVAAVRALRPDLPILDGEVLLSTWADDPWARGAYSVRSRTSPLDDAALAAPVGPIHFGGEHTAGRWHALMEGALRSGERAAAEVLGAADR